MVLKLALRNLYRHPRQTVTVGSLVTAAIALLFVGNAVFDGTETGIQESFTASFTAHLAVRARSEVEFSIFGDQTPVIGELFKMPTLAPYAEIRSALETLPGVEAVSSQVSGLALLEYKGYRAPAPLFGVEPDTYLNTMPGITLLEGRFLRRGERGVVLPEARAREMERATKSKIPLGSMIQFTVADGITFRIRSAPLLGIIRYPLRNQTLDSIVRVDPTTLRELYNYLIQSGAPPEQKENGKLQSSLKSPGTDSRASSAAREERGKIPSAPQSSCIDVLVPEQARDTGNIPPFPPGPGAGSRAMGLAGGESGSTLLANGEPPLEAEALLESLFENPAGDTEAASEGVNRETLEREIAQALQAPRPAVDEGAWNFLLIRLRPGERVTEVKRTLEQKAREEGWEVEVLDWRKTAGSTALFIYWMRTFFNIGFLVVTLTSLIILIDSLVMSVLERIPEIGTLRALGASQGVVRRLFLTETTLLAAGAGLCGVAVGIGITLFLKAHPFRLENEFLIQLFGGNALVPRISAHRALVSWAVSILLGLFGWLYPVRIALRVQPRAAMERRV